MFVWLTVPLCMIAVFAGFTNYMPATVHNCFFDNFFFTIAICVNLSLSNFFRNEFPWLFRYVTAIYVFPASMLCTCDASNISRNYRRRIFHTSVLMFVLSVLCCTMMGSQDIVSSL
jgi:hypothetical protein